MPGLTVTGSTEGWESSLIAMRRMPASIKREVNRRSRDLSEPLARRLRTEGHSQGSHAARVADTVKATSRGGLPMVIAFGLPYTLGSEFGGGRRRRTYLSRSPLGRSYTIHNRATTRQFRPFKGQEGYWWYPTLRDNGPALDEIMKTWADIVHDVIEEF